MQPQPNDPNFQGLPQPGQQHPGAQPYPNQAPWPAQGGAPGYTPGQAPGHTPGYPQQGYTAPGYTAPGYTAPGYTPGYAQPGYPQPGYAQPGYPPGFAPQPAPGYTGQPPAPAPAGPSNKKLQKIAIIVGAAAAAILVVTAIIAVLVSRPSSGPKPRHELTAESPQADRESIRQVFSKTLAGQSAGVPKSSDDIKIETLLTRWATTSILDSENFHKSIDDEKFADAVTRSPRIGRWSGADVKKFRDSAKGTLDHPGEYSELRIVDVKWSADKNEAVVCCYARNDDDAAFPLRVWLARRGEELRLYDYEYIERKRRQSDYVAAVSGLESQREGASRAAIDAWRDISQASIAIENKSIDSAKITIGSVEQRPLPPELADWVLMDIAAAWLQCGEAEKCLATCGKIGASKLADGPTPSEFTLKATAYGRLKRYAEALAELEKMAAAWGGGPAVDPRFAIYAEALGRKEQAIDYYRRFLDAFPQSPQMFMRLCDLLETGKDQEIAARLPKFVRSEAAAMAIVDTAKPGEDDAMIAEVAKFLSANSPRSAERARAEGKRLSIAGDHFGAAMQFAEAVRRATTSEDKERFFFEHLDAIYAAGHALTIFRTPNFPYAAFVHFTDKQLKEKSIPAEQWRQIVEAQNQRFPEDRRVWFWRGKALLDANNPAGARAEFEKSLANDAPATERDNAWMSACRASLYQAMHLQGETLPAYKLSEGEAFEQLAERIAFEKNADLLQTLINEHAAGKPDDPALDYQRAVLARLRKNYDEAATIAAAAYAKTTDAAARAKLSDVAAEALFEGAGPLEAQKRALDPSRTFEWLALRLTADERWTDLESLVNEVSTSGAAGAENLSFLALVWNAQALSWKKDDAGLIAALTPWPAEAVKKSASRRDRRVLVAKLLRAYIRSGKIDDGLAWVAALDDEFKAPATLALVAAADRPAELLAKLDELEAKGEGASWLSRSADLAPRLAQESFAEARLRAATPLAPAPPGDSYRLLLAEPYELTVESLRGFLEKGLGKEMRCESVALDSAQSGVSFFAIRSPKWSGSIVLRRLPYVQGEMAPWRGVKNPTLQAALVGHRASIEVIGPYRLDGLDECFPGFRAASGPRDEALMTRRIARQIADKTKCLAYDCVSDQVLLASDAAAREALVAKDAVPRMIALGDRAWSLFAPTDAAPLLSNEETARRAARQKDFAAACTSGGSGAAAPSLEVQVEVRRGPASERMWLRLKRVGDPAKSSQLYVCELSADSIVRPDLSAGKLVRLSASDVLDFRS